MFVRIDVFAIEGEVERSIGFTVLAVTIRQLAHEMSLISAFGPRFTQVLGD
jgi:hypothetical protein